MTVTSPRSAFRQLASIPQEGASTEDRLRLLSSATRQLQERGVRKHPVEVVSTTIDYTMNDQDLLILGNATGGAITITLLTAAGREGRRIIVKKTDSSNNLVTIDAAGSETLDNALTVGLSQKNAVREYVSDGANWFLISAVGNATSL